MLPTFYIPHGGGPCFFMDPPLGAPGTWDKMAAYLSGIAQSLDSVPRAILVISAHWETQQPTVTTAQSPSLIYDYYGFPENTYGLRYPAPGSPALAERLRALLAESGIVSDEDPQRGLDHGVFIPFLLIYPDAKIPIVQLSLRTNLNVGDHLAIGSALKPLREEGILIVGSGMSYHNLRHFFQADSITATASGAFDAWLSDAVCSTDAESRNDLLKAWEAAPAARICHPREEHLIPLMVVAGAAGRDLGKRDYSDHVMGKAVSGFRFG